MVALQRADGKEEKQNKLNYRVQYLTLQYNIFYIHNYIQYINLRILCIKFG